MQSKKHLQKKQVHGNKLSLFSEITCIENVAPKIYKFCHDKISSNRRAENFLQKLDLTVFELENIYFKTCNIQVNL